MKKEIDKTDLMFTLGEKNNIKTILGRVAYLLQFYPVTRNSDRQLDWKYREVFEGVAGFISRDQYLSGNLAKPTTLKRCRAIVQNKYYMYMPTDIKVAKARKINEHIWKTATGRLL